MSATPSFDIELQKIVSLQRAAELSGLSVDSLRRHYAARIIKLSERRYGMRVADALMLNEKPAA
jgi:predicted HTH domain antitoxin